MVPPDPQSVTPATKKSSELAETNVPSSPGGSTDAHPAPRAASGTAKPAAAEGAAKPPSSDGEAKKPKRINQLGDFKLEKKLGQGGMGTVYLATQVSLDRKVALKTLSPEFAKKPDFVKRFLREARSMARLQHPHVVQVYAADSVSGVNYAAIEFIDGKSMQGWMNELKTLSVGDALHVILVCADALKHAHDQNMIHRDIKPDNILVTNKGVVKVADFGLAKAVDEDVSMTQSGTGLGTPLYMAPEQARNAKHVDKRSDIYALGCTLYYFLTGKLPFSGENTLELIMAKEKGTYTPARKHNPQIPERLDLMIDKMMLKDAAHRYGDCADILRDLGGLGLANPALSFIESHGGSGTATVSAAVAAASSASLSRMSQSRTAPAMGQTAKLPPAGEHLTSAADAQRSAAMHTAAPSSKMWFVQHKGPDGKSVVTRMSTGEIMAGIKGETLDPMAKAKEGANGSFLPLNQYREFEALASHRSVKLQAEAKSKKTKDTYAKLDRQEMRRRRWKWLWKLLGNVRGFIGLIVYLVIIVVVGWLAWSVVVDYVIPRFKG